MARAPSSSPAPPALTGIDNSDYKTAPGTVNRGPGRHSPPGREPVAKYVHLRRSNGLVSEFCLGTMMFGGETDPKESARIIRRAVDAGVNLVATADVHDAGRSDEIVGQGLQDIRDCVVLASKVGTSMDAGRATS